MTEATRITGLEQRPISGLTSFAVELNAPKKAEGGPSIWVVTLGRNKLVRIEREEHSVDVVVFKTTQKEPALRAVAHHKLKVGEPWRTPKGISHKRGVVVVT